MTNDEILECAALIKDIQALQEIELLDTDTHCIGRCLRQDERQTQMYPFQFVKILDVDTDLLRDAIHRLIERKKSRIFEIRT